MLPFTTNLITIIYYCLKSCHVSCLLSSYSQLFHISNVLNFEVKKYQSIHWPCFNNANVHARQISFACTLEATVYFFQTHVTWIVCSSSLLKTAKILTEWESFLTISPLCYHGTPSCEASLTDELSCGKITKEELKTTTANFIEQQESKWDL